MAQTEKRIVMTFDKDFGELAFVGAFQQQAGSFSFV